jgi:hypothetical protein
MNHRQKRRVRTDRMPRIAKSSVIERRPRPADLEERVKQACRLGLRPMGDEALQDQTSLRGLNTQEDCAGLGGYFVGWLIA